MARQRTCSTCVCRGLWRSRQRLCRIFLNIFPNHVSVDGGGQYKTTFHIGNDSGINLLMEILFQIKARDTQEWIVGSLPPLSSAPKPHQDQEVQVTKIDCGGAGCLELPPSGPLWIGTTRASGMLPSSPLPHVLHVLVRPNVWHGSQVLTGLNDVIVEQPCTSETQRRGFWPLQAPQDRKRNLLINFYSLQISQHNRFIMSREPSNWNSTFSCEQHSKNSAAALRKTSWLPWPLYGPCRSLTTFLYSSLMSSKPDS